MSRAALKRVERFMADYLTPDSSARWEMGEGVLTAADLRAFVRLAREAEKLRAALVAVECDRDFRVRCGEPIQGVVRAALAPLPARTDFERLFTPAERRKMARGKRRGC